ncbi:MAG: ribosome silencing factor [Simkaniaceae bacterium]|nr:ribosome silencing factor [Simkaniaceae bacterium]
MNDDLRKVLELAAQAIVDKKGVNVISLDVRDVSAVAEYVIVAEGRVDRHVIALADHLQRELRKHGVRPAYVEGMQNGDWIVIDYIGVMIHLFMPGLREKYQLERLWSDGKLLELELDLGDQTAANMV